MDLPSYDIGVRNFISEYVECLSTRQRSASYRVIELSAFLFPSLSIMGLGLLLFLYDIGGCNSSPHLYVENLSTHSELSAFLFPSVCFCMTLVTLVFAIHLSHVENLSTQSELSAFFFPSLRLGPYYRRRCADVSLCLCVCSHISWETQKLSIFCCQVWVALCSTPIFAFFISIKLEIVYGRHC